MRAMERVLNYIIKGRKCLVTSSTATGEQNFKSTVSSVESFPDMVEVINIIRSPSEHFETCDSWQINLIIDQPTPHPTSELALICLLLI